MTEFAVGVVGVGRMGSGIASRLRAAGFDVSIQVHTDRSRVDWLTSLGCTTCQDVSELVAGCDLLLLCVPSSAEVEEVLSRLTEQCLPRRGIVLDCSTSLPSETVRWAEALVPLGARVYDCPLTRTPVEALEGRLNTITTCSDDDWGVVEPVLESFSENIFRLDRVGDAHRIKLLNNVMSLGQVCLAADVLDMARAADVSVATLQSLIQLGAARSAALDALVAFLGGQLDVLNFTIGMALKDIRYAALEFDPTDGIHRMLSAIEATLADAVSRGLGDDTLPGLLREN